MGNLILRVKVLRSMALMVALSPEHKAVFPKSSMPVATGIVRSIHF